MKRKSMLISCLSLVLTIAASGQILGKGHSEADSVKKGATAS